MQCQNCNYEGLREEFKKNMDSLYTSASGVKPRICPQCKQDTFFTKVDELEDDEKELGVMYSKIDKAIKAGNFDISQMRSDVKELLILNTYLGAEWVNKFADYAYRKIKEARPKSKLLKKE
ncbi:MAG: hypothetical protein SVW57_00310 [Thermodesulfobacteriota bacterium]|nr:hypothetical protein [Thermodesulfobacteriota bacterium]